ncbi:hypothetical protein OSB04_011250 [Centaurea solstitialis]|uniref:Uncharacterized protein n=1 Tax=Centaurea solstitialis TaxID=347529 RepID=A0AA38TM74_9ASTR|nr:hypothetical protein OSB04_011250 [Centaurea solstitialis]
MPLQRVVSFEICYLSLRFPLDALHSYIVTTSLQFIYPVIQSSINIPNMFESAMFVFYIYKRITLKDYLACFFNASDPFWVFVLRLLQTEGVIWRPWNGKVRKKARKREKCTKSTKWQSGVREFLNLAPPDSTKLKTRVDLSVWPRQTRSLAIAR